MIELSDIIRFISFTLMFILIEWFAYKDSKRILKFIPAAMSVSAVLSIVWSIL
jgi:hypothetical protein